MSTRNERRTSRTTCEIKGEKRQASRNKYWKDPEKHRASSRASSYACYWKDPETKRASSHACYWKDPETKRASSHTRYWEDPETKRASSRASSHTRYWEDPEKGRAASRISSHTRYWEDPEKGRAASRVSPIVVIGGTLTKKGQQLVWLIWRLQKPSSSGIDGTMPASVLTIKYFIWLRTLATDIQFYCQLSHFKFACYSHLHAYSTHTMFTASWW